MTPVVERASSKDAYAAAGAGGDAQNQLQPKWKHQVEHQGVLPQPPKPSESDLTSKMAARLAKLEQTVKAYRDEMKEQVSYESAAW
jgi:hypothetical protein